MVLTPREVAERVRDMVAGEPGDDGRPIAFGDLFARDGVLRYPFAPPGTPQELRGREAIRDFHGRASRRRALLDMDGVDLVVWRTDDPEVVVVEIEHYGRSQVLGGPYRFRALGVIRVRNGEITSYDDYMDPIAQAALMGRTADLVAALT
jgi:hypothetical protein